MVRGPRAPHKATHTRSSMASSAAPPTSHTALVRARRDHGNVVYLAQALGAPPASLPESPSEDYDSVWVVRLDVSGGFEDLDTSAAQRFDSPLSGRSYLGPSTHCGAVNPTTYPVDYAAVEAERVQP